ncbi:MULTISPECIES: biotin--[acetyl-CoA-carboxylase] ligase [Caproicibacterium]|uniref:biotin--[biotin carboxyl-carrier protein] ligase n=1 Tax=Caproicibacterium argilliputei TaxID=3030016 RepID=A0AA97H0A1_9FIRM|nr:biotin--[acetyl-CoA-carboxylase] ligase [Caproicibacterium argilliputei]WOC31243.1 biotin--[acetyl-CoA-carboxylase] ligase [Caproicibacterium argilliputei]
MQNTEALSPTEILQTLSTRTLGKRLYCLPETDSTNEEVKRLARRGAPDGTVVTAERQTGGKGRLGRAWHSPADGGLYFTVLLREAHLPQHLTNLTLLSGLAVCTTLRELYGIDARIKWPNDIVVGARKLCGILAETDFANGKAAWAAVGIGVNVNNPSFPESIAFRATSLLLETKKQQSRAAVLQRILEHLEPLLEVGTLPPTYAQLCVSLGKPVSFTYDRHFLKGKAKGITPDGLLLIELPNGRTVTVGSGEVVVQGIYAQTV